MLEGIILAGGVEQSVTFCDPALSKHFANRGYVIRVRIFVRLLRRTDANETLHVFSDCYEKKKLIATKLSYPYRVRISQTRNVYECVKCRAVHCGPLSHRSRCIFNCFASPIIYIECIHPWELQRSKYSSFLSVCI